MPRRVHTLHGSFVGWSGDHLTNVLETGQFWDEQIRASIDSADPAGTALDLGASIGWFSLYMARRFARTLAVEAHPDTYSLLVQNLEENHVDPRLVQTLWGAAYDRPTTLRLVTDATFGFLLPADGLDDTPNASAIVFTADGEGVEVPAFPLDPWVLRQQADAGWPPVSCIKVDCQGCDLRAMVGLDHTIRRDRPVVIFEFEGAASGAHGDTLQAYHDFFDALDYTVTRIREDLWDFVARPT